jgi:hypothetical protein
MLAFLFKTPLGIIISVFSGLIGIVLVLVVVTAGLAFTGGPDPCTPGGGAIEVSDVQSASFDQKWDQLDVQLDGGSPASITLTESDVTSRANRYIDDEGGDVKDLRVCIHDGFGEVTGKVDAFAGSSRFKVTGTVQLTGGRPVVDFQDVEVGNLPGAVLGPFENAVEDAIQELLDDIALKHTYEPALTEGQAQITGSP